MNDQPKVVQTELVVVVGPPAQGRSTHWPVVCADGCEDVVGVKPPTVERGVWFARDHINFAHNGAGSLRVRRPKGKRNGRK